MTTQTKNTILTVLTLIVFTALPALLFGKYVEALVFFISHWVVREQFPKQYHHIVPAICRTITAATLFFGISFVLPMELSLLSAVPISYFISWVGFIKKSSDDFEVKAEQLTAELNSYKYVDIYKMSEKELRQYAQSKGLSELICDTVVLRVIYNYRWVDIAQERNYTKDGIRYHKEQIKKKLGIKL